MKNAIIKIINDDALVNRVRTLLTYRKFVVLVPHFPPFTELRGDEASGPLVELFKLFAATLEREARFRPIHSWDYIAAIDSRRVISIAAPIYAQQRMPLPVCCFCKLGTCFLVVKKNFRKFEDFQATLGEVHVQVEDIQRRRKESLNGLDNRTPAAIYDAFDSGTTVLRRLVRKLLNTTPAKRFAIVDQHMELDIVHDLSFDRPEPIKATAGRDVLGPIKESVDRGCIVLCNSVTRDCFMKLPSAKDYFSAPLLKTPFFVSAGIPFSPEDEKLRVFFGKFISSGDDSVEDLLSQCESPGTMILPRNERGPAKVPSSGAIGWFALQSGSPDWRAFLQNAYEISQGSPQPGNNAPVRLPTSELQAEKGDGLEAVHLIETQEMLNSLRGFWGKSQDVGREMRVALAVLHGIAELVVSRKDIGARIRDFFSKHLALIKDRKADALLIENEARVFGLPVCDPQEEATAMSAYFGYVGKIEGHRARVILVDDKDSHILDDLRVPCNWLPIAYRSEGAGVAWIERQYASGSKGRFEPASTGGDDEHA